MRHGAGSAVAGAITLGLVAACTGGGGGIVAPRPSDASTSPPQTTPSTGEEGLSQPLVVISNVHRSRLDLDIEQARALVHGRIDAVRTGLSRQAAGPVSLARGPHPVAVVRRTRAAIAVVPASRVGPDVRVATVEGIDPLLRPDAYPFRYAATRSAPVVTTMTFVGDIMLGRGVAAANPHDPAHALAAYAHRLRSADLAVGNLECTLSRDGRPRQGTDSFAARPSVVPGLERAGIDLLTLANNHTGDFGPRALEKTLTRIDHSAIARVGAGRDAAEAWSPVVLRRNGLSFGFLAFNAIGETPRATSRSPGAAEIRMQPRLGPLNESDLARMTGAVRRLAARADVVTVLPHWGTQYSHSTVADQRRVARALVDAGADLVVGSHPHWVQGMQSHDGGLIAYSLGNFVFDMGFSRQTMEGIALDVTFWGDRLVAAAPAPFVLDPRFAPRPALGTRGDRVLDDVWRASLGSFEGRQQPTDAWGR